MTSLLALIPLGLGAVLGGQAAEYSSLGGLAGLNALVYVFLGLVAVTTLCVIGIIALLGRKESAGRAAFVAAALLVVGGFVGSISIGAFGLDERAPVLQSTGTASLDLEGVDGWSRRIDGPATCRSRPDSTGQVLIESGDLGELLGGTVQGLVTLGLAGSVGPGTTLSVWIDPQDLVLGAVRPGWRGTVGTGQGTPDSGSVRFDELALEFTPFGDPPREGPRPSIPPWPATIGGTFRWDCGS